jgi:hypothetical protein
MPFNLTLQYLNSEKGKTHSVWIVNPDHRIEISGEDLVELLSKFLVETALLQRKIYEEELEAHMIRRMDDDIPF